MFTGLIEEIGTIKAVQSTGQGMVLSIACQKVLEDAAIGDSIAIDGICLTVTQLKPDGFIADAIPETVQRTHLPFKRPGAKVNLERAMTLGKRMGGHLVQGHVDGVAQLIERKRLDNATLFRFQGSSELTDYMVDKGSITINGISLTLVEATDRTFGVSVIPHTLEVTNLQQLSLGDQVNIECDLIGKYVAKFMSKKTATSSTLTIEQIKQAGRWN